MGCIQVSGREGLDSHTWCVPTRNVKRSNPFHSGSDLLKLLQGTDEHTLLELSQLAPVASRAGISPARMGYRRSSKDYEAISESSESWIHIAMTHLMLQRLDRA